jgi:hypothetical protein
MPETVAKIAFSGSERDLVLECRDMPISYVLFERTVRLYETIEMGIWTKETRVERQG